jgi:N-acetylglutamate synthase-like GNAT family acetyltransferase
MVQIRQARIEEVDEIGELAVQAYRAGGHLEENDRYEQVLRNVQDRLEQTVVAVRDGEIIGCVSICPPGSPCAEVSQPGECEFRFLAIRPEDWGTGVAAHLVHECELRARASGAHTMVISVISINTRAQRFYERLGYVRAPSRDWSPPPQTSACGVRNIVLLGFEKSLDHIPNE